MIQVKIKNKGKHELPQYKSTEAAGMDLQANLKESIRLEPFCRAIVTTGIYIELPTGYEAQIRSRSGLASKFGIVVANSPGTIDSDYRGEIKVILSNISNEPFYIHDGERIAQMVVAKVERAEWEQTDSLSDTERGEGGLGHTGL